MGGDSKYFFGGVWRADRGGWSLLASACRPQRTIDRSIGYVRVWAHGIIKPRPQHDITQPPRAATKTQNETLVALTKYFAMENGQLKQQLVATQPGGLGREKERAQGKGEQAQQLAIGDRRGRREAERALEEMEEEAARLHLELDKLRGAFGSLEAS